MISKILMLFFCLFLTGFAFSADSIIVEKDNVVFDLAAKSWRTDRLFKTSVSLEKTPDNETPLKIEVSEENQLSNINGASFPFEKLKNLQSEWNALSFWIKPNDSDVTVKLDFQSFDESGKQQVYVFIFKLIGKEWTKLSFNAPSWTNTTNWKFHLADIRSCHICVCSTFGKKTEFLIGPLTFHLNTGNIPLSELSVLDVPKAPSAPVLDGRLEDQCWEKAASITSYILLGETKATEMPFDTRISYDDKNIYVGVSQKLDVSKLRKRQTTPQVGVYEDDSLNFFLSPANDGKSSYQFIVNSIGVRQSVRYCFDQIMDSFVRQSPWEGKWTAASFIGKDFWSSELVIPYADFSPEVKPGDIIGMQSSFINPSLANGAWSWTATGTNLCTPENFGVMNMVERLEEKFPLKNVGLRFNGNIPAVELTTGSTLPCKATVFIANPAGRIFRASSEITGSGMIAVNDYQICSGVQRLTVVAEAPGYMRTVRCFKSEAVFFAHKTSFDKNILCPEPKECTEHTGRWNASGREFIFIPEKSDAKTLRSAERLKEDLAGYMQFEIEIKPDKSLPENCIAIGKSPEVLAEKAAGPKSSKLTENGAYVLEISSDGIILRGKDPEGLFYAVLTLAQLERYAFMRNEKYLSATLIRDWPSCPFRIFKNATQGLNIRDCKLSHTEMLNYIYKMLDRYVIDVKMNSFSLLMVDSIKYDKEENRKIDIYPRATFLDIPKLKRLNSYCSLNYVEFIPAISGPSHCLWMTIPYPSLAMPGYLNWDANPSDAKFFPIYFSVMDEIIDAIHPESFIIMQDEWWHKPTGEISSKYNGNEKRDIFKETVEKIYEHLKAQNIKTMMFSDMLQRQHNGGMPYNNYLNAPMLPKDIAMMHWSNCKQATSEFAKMGYQENWLFTNRFRPHGLTESDVKNMKISGCGIIAYASMSPDVGYGYASNLRGADYAWNLGGGNEIELNDWIIEKGRNVIANSSIRRNPAAGTDFVPLNLSASFNESWNSPEAAGTLLDSFDGGMIKAGYIPMETGKKTDKFNCIMADKKSPCIIPVDKNASSIIFLHTQFLGKDKVKEFVKGKNRFDCWDGVKIGAYKINYEDGSSGITFIRSAENCGNILPYKGLWGASVLENTYLADCRFVMEISGRENAFLYQYEWVNPHPEKKISSIEFMSYGTVAKPVLFAVTLRDVKK